MTLVTRGERYFLWYVADFDRKATVANGGVRIDRYGSSNESESAAMAAADEARIKYEELKANGR
jgi:hypothetical protein